MMHNLLNLAFLLGVIACFGTFVVSDLGGVRTRE